MPCGEPVEIEREDESTAWWRTVWELTHAPSHIHLFSRSVLHLLSLVFSSKKDGLRLNNQPLSSCGLTWNTVPGTDMVAGYVKQYDANSMLMTMRHVNDDVFSVHVTSKRVCEAETMPLTYGKPLPPTSVSCPFWGTLVIFDLDQATSQRCLLSRLIVICNIIIK